MSMTPEEIRIKRAEKAVYDKAYRKTHHAEKVTKDKAYRVANYLEISARRKIRYQQNRQEITLKNKESYQRNRGKRILYSRTYYETHKPALTVQRKAYKEAHKDTIAANGRMYRETHKLQIAAKKLAYSRAHPERDYQHQATRRARKAQASHNDLTHAQWIEIQTAQAHRCYYCGKRCKGHLTQDHITSLAKGGSHTLHNVIGACNSCNGRKGIQSPPVPVQPFLLTIAPARKRKAS